MTRIRTKDRTIPFLLALFAAVFLLASPLDAQAGVGEEGYPLPDMGTSVHAYGERLG